MKMKREDGGERGRFGNGNGNGKEGEGEGAGARMCVGFPFFFFLCCLFEGRGDGTGGRREEWISGGAMKRLSYGAIKLWGEEENCPLHV